MPSLSIGMPVHNGAPFLAAALDSLVAQEFRDWTLLISDNASDDGTAAICADYCGRDGRIRYVRQAVDLGAMGNFQYLIDRAESEYFMWAAADDLWHPAFASACVSRLADDRGCQMAFCNLVNIDTYGRRVREYPSFSRFASRDRRKNVSLLLAEPEILGKANLIYSVYRTAFLKGLLKEHPFSDCWGCDMVFVLSALARTFLALDERTLFMKRDCRPGDRPERTRASEVLHYEDHVFPWRGSLGYWGGCRRVLRRTPYHSLGWKVMGKRVARVWVRSLAARLRRFSGKTA